MREDILTSIFAQLILDAPLYDTGDLYRSVQVFSQYRANNLVFIIECNDYVKYHIERTQLLEKFARMPEFADVCSQKIADRIQEFIALNLPLTEAIPAISIEVIGIT